MAIPYIYILSSRTYVFKDIFRPLEVGLSKFGHSATKQANAILDLLDLINDSPTDGSQGYDVLGFIYDYLISKFMANADKKADGIHTPHEVSGLISGIAAAHIRGRDTNNIYERKTSNLTRSAIAG